MPEPNSIVTPPPEAQSVGWTLLRRCLPWILVVGMVLAIVTAFIIVLAFIVPQIRQLVQDSRSKPPTFGDIHVNTPKVYTRERLVNDRFRQQAWLDSQLQRTEELVKGHAFAGIEGQSRRRESQHVSVAGGLGARAPESNAQTAEGGPPVATQGVKSDRDAFLPEPINEFRDALAYRDDIRAELMRTQLDDRHDLQGNTLYRLDFDVTIAPGDNTGASANITIQVEEDRSEEHLKHYALLYADWHKLLQMTINGAIRDQTLEILSPGGDLDGPEQIPFQEFIAQELCRALSRIVVRFGGEDASSCEDANFQSAVQQAVTGYVFAYKHVRQDSLNRDSIDNLVTGISSLPEDLKGQDLPEPLIPLRSMSDSLSRQQQKEALSYAEKQCEGAMEGNFSVKLPKKPGKYTPSKGEPSEGLLIGPFPCPYTLSLREPLWGAIIMLDRVPLLGNLGAPKLNELGVADMPQLVERIGCLIDPDELAKSTSDSLRKLSEGCSQLFGALTNDPTLKDDLYGLPRVRKAFVRKLIAEYMGAKLDNKLRSWRVLSPITNFFTLRLGGCELEACTLLLESKMQVRSEHGGQLTYDETMLRHLQTMLNAGVRTFAYTVTPAEFVQRLASEASTRATLHAALRTASPGSNNIETILSGLRELEHEIDMRYRHPIIVGFGTPPAVGDEPPKTVFGWVIHPRLMPQREPGDKAYRQTARHYPLSAVISVPSWWKSLKVAVRTQWVDGNSAESPKKVAVRTQWVDGDSAESPKKAREPDPYHYYIQVPGSVREIREKLRFEVRTEPYIDFNSMHRDGHGTQSLEVGRPARIILEGGRLWRSTVVTMGNQQADKIEVLPDMTGIIAEFKCVRPPPGESGTESLKGRSFPVTVWTSEGVTAAPWRVELREFTSRNKSDKNGSENKNAKDLPCFLEESSRDNKEGPPEHQGPDR